MPEDLTPQPDSPPFSHRQIIIILIGLMLGTFLAALDQTILGAALPKIAASLRGDQALSWVVSAYLLAVTAATPLYGKLSDLYGRKRLLQVAVVIFLSASVLCALSETMLQLIACRILQGLGGAGLLVMGMTVLADIVSPRERGRYLGYMSGVWLVASMVGPAMGGFFVDHLSWRWVFWINLPIGAGALYMSQRTLGVLKVPRIRHDIDYVGGTLIVAAVSCLLLVTTLGGTRLPWDGPAVIWLTIAAIVLTILAVLQELRASEPIVPPRLFHGRNFAVANLGGACHAMSLLGTQVFGPVFLQMVYGVDAETSGLIMIPFLVVGPTTVMITGRRVTKTGRYRKFPIIGTAMAGIVMMLLGFVGPATPLLWTIILMTCFGIGTGLAGPIFLLSMQNEVDFRDMGTGTAAFSFFRSIGAALGVALFGAVIVGRLNVLLARIAGSDVLDPSAGMQLLHAGAAAIRTTPVAIRDQVAVAVTTAYQDMFLVGALICCIGCACALCIAEAPLRNTTARTETAALVD